MDAGGDTSNSNVVGVLPPLSIEEYLDMMAEDAAFMRQLHGGDARWWVGHKWETCAVCQMVSPPIDTRPHKPWQSQKPATPRVQVKTIATVEDGWMK